MGGTPGVPPLLIRKQPATFSHEQCHHVTKTHTLCYIVCVKRISWSSEKDAKLRKEKGIGFEDAVFQIARGEILDILENPNARKYPNQRVFVLEIREYVYYVPFVEDDSEVFLKAIIPSRRLKKEYRGGREK